MYYSQPSKRRESFCPLIVTSVNDIKHNTHVVICTCLYLHILAADFDTDRKLVSSLEHLAVSACNTHTHTHTHHKTAFETHTLAHHTLVLTLTLIISSRSPHPDSVTNMCVKCVFDCHYGVCKIFEFRTNV